MSRTVKENVCIHSETLCSCKKTQFSPEQVLNLYGGEGGRKGTNQRGAGGWGRAVRGGCIRIKYKDGRVKTKPFMVGRAFHPALERQKEANV